MGISLPMHVNVGIEVKNKRVKTFGANSIHLNDSVVLVSGQKTIIIYLQQYISPFKC